MKILAHIHSIEHYTHTIKKLEAHADTLDLEFHYFGNHLSDHVQLCREGRISHLIDRATRIPDIELPHEASFYRHWNLKESERLFYSSIATLKKLMKTHAYELFLLRNGHCPMCLGLKKVAEEYGVRTLFFELANLDGKLFVDPKGSNAYSILYEDINLLVRFPADEKAYQLWRERYVTGKLEKHIVKQSLQVDESFKEKLIRYYYAYYRQLLQGMPKPPETSLSFFLEKSFKRFKSHYDYNDFDFRNQEYIFFPMQVSTDTQLLLNSDIDNIQAITMCADIAREKGVKLCVKPHPAENNQYYIKRVHTLQKDLGFVFVNDNTFQLIAHAQEVITINSTAGLEAKILGRPTRFLGRSFYQNMDERHLMNYIMSYLANVEYFDEAPIPIEEAENILSRQYLSHQAGIHPELATLEPKEPLGLIY